MIRKLTERDRDAIYHIINRAAQADRGYIPNDCYKEPYMSHAELRREMSQMKFFGWEEKRRLVGVAGFQPVKDVTLARHVYVLPEYQRHGIGSHLLQYLEERAKTRRFLVGAWAGARWAINFYQKLGFKMQPDKERLLETYWDVPRRQMDISVVLGTEMQPGKPG